MIPFLAIGAGVGAVLATGALATGAAALVAFIIYAVGGAAATLVVALLHYQRTRHEQLDYEQRGH